MSEGPLSSSPLVLPPPPFSNPPSRQPRAGAVGLLPWSYDCLIRDRTRPQPLRKQQNDAQRRKSLPRTSPEQGTCVPRQPRPLLQRHSQQPFLHATSALPARARRDASFVIAAVVRPPKDCALRSATLISFVTLDTRRTVSSSCSSSPMPSSTRNNRSVTSACRQASACVGGAGEAQVVFHLCRWICCRERPGRRKGV